MLIRTSGMNESQLEKRINVNQIDITKPVNFLVMEASFMISSKGKDMIRLVLACFQNDFSCEPDQLKKLYDYILIDLKNDYHQMKLLKFLSSIDMREEYLSGQFDLDMISPNLSTNSFRIGSCMLKEEDTVNKEGQPIKRFVVDKYLFNNPEDFENKDVPFNDDINF